MQVLLDGAPATDALVMIGGLATRWPTDADGTVRVERAELAALQGQELVVMAAHEQARTRPKLNPDLDAGALTIELHRFDPTDNLEYAFQDPGEPTRRESTAQCAHCHVTINEHWFASPHRTAASNPVVTDLYDGTASALLNEADCVGRDGQWRVGPKPGGGGQSERCYFGDGVLSALNPCPTPRGCAPKRFGACADCHAPGIDGKLGGRNLADATGVAFDYGVYCDVCHRVESVDLPAKAGVAGRLRLLRPSEPSPSPGLGDFLPLTFGPWPDVPIPIMGGVEREHYHDGSLCAGCHELDQPALVPGESLDTKRWPSAALPIHSTFSEWSSSLFASSPCQSCHMPPDPSVGNGADLYNLYGGPEGIAAGWKRPPGSVRQHSWLGPRAQATSFAQAAAEVLIEKSITSAEVVAKVTVKNVGAGHAVPTGEPLRSLVLTVAARCGDTLLEASGGDAIPDFGGYYDRREKGQDWSTWPGAKAGEVVRVVRRTGAFRDYLGFGPFGDGTFDALQKGMPEEEVVGSRKIQAVQGAMVTFEAPLPEGDVAYRVDATELVIDGSPVLARAGAAGFAFARVLVGADGRRMVPHFLAVDVASDNRILPQREVTTTHRFPKGCDDPEVVAVLAHRAYPFDLVRGRGFSSKELVLTESEK